MDQEQKTSRKNILAISFIGFVIVGGIAVAVIFYNSSGSAKILENLNSGGNPVVLSATSTPGVYRDDGVGFSFSYPLDATLTTSGQIDDPDGLAILVKAKSGEEVQTTIAPFDENISLTADRIKKDLPTMTMNNVKIAKTAAAAGAAAAQTVYFETATTRELWLVSNGYLYQISGLLTDSRALFDKISGGFTITAPARSQ